MMAGIRFISLVALFLVSRAHHYHAIITNKDLSQQFELGDKFNQGVRDALLKLRLDGRSNLDEIRQQLGNLYKEDAEHREVYAGLLRMSSLTCSDSSIELVKSIMAQMKAGTPDSGLDKIARIILDLVIRPMTNRAKSMADVCELHREDCSAILNDFDVVFSAASGLAELQDEQLLQTESRECQDFNQWLANLDLIESKLNVRNLIIAVRKTKFFEDLDSDWQAQILDNDESYLEPFELFMDEMCGQRHLRAILGMRNLNAAVNGQEDKLPPRNLRLNEYNRLCRDWLKPVAQNLIIENLEEQMAASHSE
jgi:hypothetical protein